MHDAPKATLHHLDQSRSQRIVWLLEEIGLPYDIVYYKRDAKTFLAPPELKRVHPLGKAPVVTIDGLTLAESGAIVETLVERYAPHLAPAPGTPEALTYRYWLHYAEGSAMPPLLLKLVLQRMAAAPMPFFVKPIAKAIAQKTLQGFVAPQLALHLGYMNSALAGRDWFAGPAFTAADVQMSFPVEAAESRAGLNAAEHPHLSAWLARIRARAAYQRARAQGMDAG